VPCPSQDFVSTLGQEVADFLFLHSFTAGVQFEPQDKPELVAAVVASTRSGRSLRALGSNWSLSAAGVADNVVDTGALRMFLSQPYPLGVAPLDPSRIRGSGSDFLAKACAGDPRAAGRHYVHVEAGIKIKDLLTDLGSCGLALPTMGDGAGQSLIGALSTATHGADFQVAPLVEWIRAVHLVGPAGQEWWITPQASLFGDALLASTLPDWCPDARVVSDDDAFNAVRVGVGRMGVIYSVILEVVPAYTLVEVNLEHRWSEVRAQLASSSVTGGTLLGIFDAPLADLDSGWFRTQVLERTWGLFSEGGGWDYVPGPPHDVLAYQVVLAHFDFYPQAYFDLLSEDLGLADLAADLRGGATMPLHHMNLAISLSTPDRCWIRRRWSRQEAVRALGLAPGEDDPLVAAVKANKANPPGIVQPLKDRIELSAILFFFGWLFHDPRWSRLNWYLYTEIERIADDHAKKGATSGEALFYILYTLATDPVLDSGGDVASAASEIIAQAFSKLARAGPASGGVYENILDLHDYGLDGAESGDSVEFHFDASSGAYLDFIDAVVVLAGVHFPVFGYIGIRFTPGATALIAMQQFGLTASVEVSTPRTRLQDVYADFWTDVHKASNTRGGIPHWGQEFRQSAEDLAARYGDRLVRWRSVLADLVDESPDVFSTAFSRDRGLEPAGSSRLFDDDAIEQFLLGLEGGPDYVAGR
jgi:hypothetical protein